MTITNPQIWRAEVYEWRTDPPLLGQEPMECPYIVAIHHCPTEAEAQQAADSEIAAMLEYRPGMKLTASIARNARPEIKARAKENRANLIIRRIQSERKANT